MGGDHEHCRASAARCLGDVRRVSRGAASPWMGRCSTCRRVPVAQWTEQPPSKRPVAGSNPAGDAAPPCTGGTQWRHDPWRKSSLELVERFHEAVAGIEGVEVRKMFGYPAAFIGGNLTAGLHQENVMVRLPDGERRSASPMAGRRFEPMPGRPMREYVALPPEVAADVDAMRHWVERAAAHVRTLPPKAAEASRSATARYPAGWLAPGARRWRRSHPRAARGAASARASLARPGRRRPPAPFRPAIAASRSSGDGPRCHAEPMEPIGPVALIADVRHDHRRQAGGRDRVGRAGAAVVDDERGPREEGAVVDRRRRWSRPGDVGTRLERTLDDDPPPGLEQPVDRAAQLAGRDASHRAERDHDRRRAIGQEGLRPLPAARRAPSGRTSAPVTDRSRRQVGRDADDRRRAGDDVQQRRSRPEERQAALRAPGAGEQHRRAAGRCATSARSSIHQARRFAGPRFGMPGGGALRGGQQDRIEHGGRPAQPGVQGGGMRQRVDAVEQDDVVAGQQLSQPTVGAPRHRRGGSRAAGRPAPSVLCRPRRRRPRRCAPDRHAGRRPRRGRPAGPAPPGARAT